MLDLPQDAAFADPDQERDVAVVVLRSRAAMTWADWLRDRLGLTERAAILDPRHAAIVLPRLGEAAAIVRATELVSRTELAAGVAIAPHDGLDHWELVATGRAIAANTNSGAIGRSTDLVERLELPGKTALIGDPQTRAAYALIRRLARGTMPIAIYGETGTGKELAAAAVHMLSRRADGPFVAINCAAIPEGLAEAELFGHARGAFTGASTARTGHFEAASGGTLFLDEVAELSPVMQARLLRVLECGEIRRLGETEARRLDLRVVTATHRDLAAEVAAGRFRRDLLHRIGPAIVALPALRERTRDLPQLAQAFLTEACARAGRAEARLSPATVRVLAAHAWPGNVRELRHAIDYAIAVAPDTATQVAVEHLPPSLRVRRPPSAARPKSTPPPRSIATPATQEFRLISDELQALERRRMVEALAATGGVQNKAAKLIGMPMRTFASKFRRYAIDRTEW